MKYYSESIKDPLHPDLKKVLEHFRKERNFDVDKYIDEKVYVISKYMTENNIDSCVVALSGGIDSAVVYALLKEVEKLENSPLKKLVALTLPVLGTDGAINQEATRNKSANLCDQFGDEVIDIDLEIPFNILRSTVCDRLGIDGGDWADGQLVSYLRTPTYYYVTSLLSQEGYRPIVCGTTNLDEGAYLGYFGKASDGMVDVQLISDIHKSEVYKVAKHFGITKEIIDAVPMGDMYDNRDDEEVFGASYDFVELYMNYLKVDLIYKLEYVRGLCEEAKDQFFLLRNNLEKMHDYNSHKYLGCSPAVHFDVYESKIDGGWKYFVYK